MTARVAIVDFETRSDRDLKKVGVEKYVESPHFEPTCLAHCFDDRDGADQPLHGWQILKGPPPPAPVLELFEHVRAGGEFVAHNARFEIFVWNEMHRREPWLWPELKPEQVTDTIALARAMSLPAALEHVAPALRLPFEKDKEGHRVMLKLCKPRKPRKGEPKDALLWNEDPADFERQLAYCVRDVEVERAVWRKLPPLIPSERDLWLLDQRINDTGVRVDVDAVRLCLDVAEQEKERLNRELFVATDGYVKTANSAKALREWLAAWGVELPDLRKGTVDAALQRGDLLPEPRRVLEVRREAAKASTAKLKAMTLGTCADGTLKGLLEFYGAASTGRWSGRRFQPQNLPRTPETFGAEQAADVFAWMGL